MPDIDPDYKPTWGALPGAFAEHSKLRRESLPQAALVLRGTTYQVLLDQEPAQVVFFAALYNLNDPSVDQVLAAMTPHLRLADGRYLRLYPPGWEKKPRADGRLRESIHARLDALEKWAQGAHARIFGR